jgi:hypothetical protein
VQRVRAGPSAGGVQFESTATCQCKCIPVRASDGNSKVNGSEQHADKCAENLRTARSCAYVARVRAACDVPVECRSHNLHFRHPWSCDANRWVVLVVGRCGQVVGRCGQVLGRCGCAHTLHLQSLPSIPGPSSRGRVGELRRARGVRSDRLPAILPARWNMMSTCESLKPHGTPKLLYLLRQRGSEMGAQ